MANYAIDEWHFIEFGAALDANAIARLSDYVGYQVDPKGIKPEWRTADRGIDLPVPVERLYLELQERAAVRPNV